MGNTQLPRRKREKRRQRQSVRQVPLSLLGVTLGDMRCRVSA